MTGAVTVPWGSLDHMTGVRVLLVPVALAACAAPMPWGHAVEPVRGDAGRPIPIAITKHGFDPSEISVAAGETVRLIFTRRVERTCVKRVVVSLDQDRTLERDLPLDTPVSVTLQFDRPGELGYACPMARHGGKIVVR